MTNTEKARALRILCWSGPRNISTAMMRSWEARGDTAVCDEPLYAHYLLEHGLDHPGREEILAHHESDAEKVVEWLTGPVPGGKPIWYQKQMSHHLLPDVPRYWLDRDDVRHMFLIREPREMLTSLMQVLPEPRLEDTGLPQQVEIHRRMLRRGHRPPIVDTVDVLGDPEAILSAVCEALDVEYVPSMLAWEPGRRVTDGVWAEHWYDAVERSTGFQKYEPKGIPVPERLRGVLAEAEPLYQELAAERLR
ncbi:MAG: HAD family hydrolase [Acidobacteria bacterium]|nr:MAG: HAD family hydrolase [Acidobacteriota bacterium]REK00921.1 MAG: HAD family hydrolase [Acidobacteriota bacterium]